ncbi:hypothetical protein [Halobacillus mangrovi]|uniref:Uncharacterized protein n=1 Tax=Halobacillus mangrovi TaxID=402384 RepID=A0A1W5ZSK4_9BACI|nr:hypothetical protein [Halobacillus mangrovi]ARI76263.1 hypothetical protein HM131_05170 [Halobacillus mangrovi]
MTDSLKKDYLLLPISNSTLCIEPLGQNPTLAMTKWKQTHFKTEAPTKSEAIKKMLSLIVEGHTNF